MGPRALCGLALALLGCARAAHRAAGRGTEAALEAVRQEQAAADAGVPSVGRVAAANIVDGALEELSRPEQIERLEGVVRAVVYEAVDSLTLPRAGEPRQPGTGGSAPQSAIELLSEELAKSMVTAFARALRQELGARGEGPLGDAVVVTSQRAAAAGAVGVKHELGWAVWALPAGLGALFGGAVVALTGWLVRRR